MATFNISINYENLIIVLVIAVTHGLFSRYTSMCVQGIKSATSNKRIRQAPKIRMFALNLYIRWFWFHPAMLIVNLFVYGATWFMYIYIYTVTAAFFADGNLRPEWFIQGAIYATFICVNVFTVFYMINLGYATLKRLGIFFGRCCGCPFPNCWFIYTDGTTYAKPMNKALAECNASFRMNNYMTSE